MQHVPVHTAQMQQWLLCPGDWVEPPNQRRGGLSGVQRVQLDDGRLLYRKQQVGHLYHSWRHPLGYPTLMRERDALYDCLRLGVPVPPLLLAQCARQAGQWHAWLVTADLTGFASLEQCYAEQRERGWGTERHAQILECLGRALGRLNGGRQHGWLFSSICLSAGALPRLDLEKSRWRELQAADCRPGGGIWRLSKDVLKQQGRNAAACPLPMPVWGSVATHPQVVERLAAFAGIPVRYLAWVENGQLQAAPSGVVQDVLKNRENGYVRSG